MSLFINEESVRASVCIFVCMQTVQTGILVALGKPSLQFITSSLDCEFLCLWSTNIDSYFASLTKLDSYKKSGYLVRILQDNGYLARACKIGRYFISQDSCKILQEFYKITVGFWLVRFSKGQFLSIIHWFFCGDSKNMPRLKAYSSTSLFFILQSYPVLNETVLFWNLTYSLSPNIILGKVIRYFSEIWLTLYHQISYLANDRSEMYLKKVYKITFRGIFEP